MEYFVWDDAGQNYRSLFFSDRTVTAHAYMDKLQLYAVSQLPDGTIYQQDGAPPHFANMIRTFLDE